MFIRARETVARYSRGQTMTEYTLVVADSALTNA
jgi:hypothetical protein